MRGAPCVLPRRRGEKDRAVALMRRVEAGVQVSMSYCINRAVSISSNPFDLLYSNESRDPSR